MKVGCYLKQHMVCDNGWTGWGAISQAGLNRGKKKKNLSVDMWIILLNLTDILARDITWQ